MLRWELEQYSGIALLEGAPPEDTALIRMIHSKDYYQSNDEPDVYAGAPKNCVVQHVTVEDFHLNGLNQRKTREKEDPALRKVIQELAIKLDVSQRQIKCYDWPALGFSGPVTFVMASQDFILIGTELKRKGNRDAVFGGMLDIRHFCEDDAQYYYSGYRGKSLNRSLPHACRI